MQQPRGYERRKSRDDRRNEPRTGKYDRRKNTCGICQYYKPQSPNAGLCQKHQQTVRLQEFSCIWFSANPTEPTEPVDTPQEEPQEKP